MNRSLLSCGRPKTRDLSPQETPAPMIRRAAAADICWMSDLDPISPDQAHVSGDPAGPRASLLPAAARNFHGDVVLPIGSPNSIRQKTAKSGALREVNLLVVRVLVVGPKVAGVLSQFDRGAGALHPLTVPDHTGAVSSENSHFVWNFGTKRNTFLPEDSEGLRKSTHHAGPGRFPCRTAPFDRAGHDPFPECGSIDGHRRGAANGQGKLLQSRSDCAGKGRAPPKAAISSTQ
jgi:hypothetical protein